MLVQRSIPTHIDMIACGKMHIRGMLSRIPSVSSQDLSIHFGVIELELDHYLELQECVMALLDNTVVSFITPLVLSYL